MLLESPGLMSQKTRPTAGIQKARTLALKGNGYVDLKCSYTNLHSPQQVSC